MNILLIPMSPFTEKKISINFVVFYESNTTNSMKNVLYFRGKLNQNQCTAKKSIKTRSFTERFYFQNFEKSKTSNDIIVLSGYEDFCAILINKFYL